MTARAMLPAEDATIKYLCARADHCRQLAQRTSDDDEVAELMRLADLFTSVALRLAAHDGVLPRQI